MVFMFSLHCVQNRIVTIMLILVQINVFHISCRFVISSLSRASKKLIFHQYFDYFNNLYLLPC